MKTRLLFAFLLIALLTMAGTAAAGSGDNNRNFVAHLSSDEEVNTIPDFYSRAQGQAIFHLSKDGQSIEYKLISSNIENIWQAHIHLAPAGANGSIVVWLYPSGPPAQQIPGRFSGVLARGTITAANLIGPLAGQGLDDLVAAMLAGNTYVNVHTNDLVNPANTGPGDFPGGEIRGQIR